MTQDNISPKVSLGDRVKTELREFSILAGYLYISFTAIAYLKYAILHSQGVDFLPWAFAAIKAIICAKFMLIGRALHIGEGYKNSPLIFPTLHRSFGFLLLLITLNVFEEIVVGLIHGHPISESIGEIAGGSLDQMVATSFVVLLILIPYFAFRSLGEVIGDHTLVRLYFERRNKTNIKS